MAKPTDITGGLTITYKKTVMTPEEVDLKLYLSVAVNEVDEDEYQVVIEPFEASSEVPNE